MNLKDKTILQSLGLLDKNETEEFKKEILNSSEENRRFVSEMNNLVSLFPKAINKSFDKFSPPDRAKVNLFKKIGSPENSVTNPIEAKFNFVLADSGDWIDHPEVEGVKIKQLSFNKEKNYAMLLMKVAAGTEYPAHHHGGAEECYVIEGDLYAQGQILGPGDFHHAESGSDHEPLYTKNGCKVILVVDTTDY